VDDAARLKGKSDVACPVWPVATQQDKLTARRLVITFVPTTGWKLEDSRRAGAVTQVPSESSHRTRSIAAMTAGSSGSSPSARTAWAFVIVHTVLDVRRGLTVPPDPAGLVHPQERALARNDFRAAQHLLGRSPGCRAARVCRGPLVAVAPPSEVSRQCRRAGVFIKARWAALARPVELLLARAEAEEPEPAEAGLGFGLVPGTPNKPVAGRGHA
jgi:hypothetical protein